MVGEIAWRWSFGAAAWALVILVVRGILSRVDLSRIERLIARDSDLFAVADACARVIVQVLPAIARACAVVVPGIAVLWIAAASVGRAATLRMLLAQPHARWSALVGLHVVRAVVTLAAVAAFFGTMLPAGMAMPALDPTVAALAWITLGLLVIFFWSLVNWFLGLAPIWIARDQRTALRSIADSVNLFQRNSAAYLAIATWFGVFRGIALVAALIAALVAAQAPPATAVALGVVIALIYFAIADFLYAARLAAFVELNESYQRSAFSSQPVSPTPLPASAPEA